MLFFTVLAFLHYELVYNVFILVLKNSGQCTHVIQEDKSAEKLESIWNDTVRLNFVLTVRNYL